MLETQGMVPTAGWGGGVAVGTVALGRGANVTDTLHATQGPLNFGHELGSIA